MPDATNAPADLQTYVNDMHGLNSHIHEAVSRQMEDEKVKHESPVLDIITKLHGFYHHHTEETQKHVDRLGTPFAGKAKEVITAALGVAAGLYDKVRKDPMSRMLRDNYVASNLATISFTMLQTTALAFNDHSLATYCEGAIKELNPLIMRLGEVIPAVVARELKEDSPQVDVAVSVKPVLTMKEAWNQPPNH